MLLASFFRYLASPRRRPHATLRRKRPAYARSGCARLFMERLETRIVPGFLSGLSYNVGVHPSAVAVGDFTGDGIANLAVPNLDSGTVSVLLGNGDGTFQAAVNYAVGSNPDSVDYRAGRDEEAVKWMGRAAPHAGGTHWDATKFAVLAMAHRRRGRPREAEAALANAKAIVAKTPDPAKGRPFGAGNWHDWVQAQLFYREAENLMRKGSGKK